MGEEPAVSLRHPETMSLSDIFAVSLLRGYDSMKLGLLAAGLCLLAGCVTKTEFQPYQNLVQDLEADTARIEKRLPEIEGSVKAVREGQANLRADLIDVRNEIQQLRGELSSGLHEKEVVGKERQSVEESVSLQLSYLQKQMQATEVRLARIEDYFGLKPPEAAPAAKAPAAQGAPQPKPQTPAESPQAEGGGEGAAAAAPAAPPKQELTPEEAYEMAYHLFQSNQNEAAREAFEQFMRRYPESALVDNALFWIGETYYRAGDYEKAVLNYQQVVTKYPKGSKGPDALLKMGYALEKMNEPEAAIAAMEKLLKTYPQAPQAKLATRKIEQLKSNEAGPKKDKGNEAKQSREKSAAEANLPEKKPHTEVPS
jgi:tol-pal system protein YbgF